MALAKGNAEVPEDSRKRLERKFKGMMKALYKEEGASLRIEILDNPAVSGFVDEHSGILDSSFVETEMSDTLRSKLKESDYIFSGIKTFHELNEAFPSLLDENGDRKPFERFLNDVQKIDKTYNDSYLYAEYNQAQASAEMAAKWEEFEQDGDEYYLQYRTAGDDKVRPEHAALNGVTLPMSDPFWDEFYPPNGWNCRCTVVEVLKSKYQATDRAEAFQRGSAALAKDTKGIFRFNSGKQQKTFPDYNAYTLSKCDNCTRKLNLAKSIPDNELCDACLYIRKCVANHNGYYPDSEMGERLMISSKADLKDIELNIKTARDVLRAFPKSKMEIRRNYTDGRKNPEYTIDGLIADRKGIESFKGIVAGFQKGLEQGCNALIFDLDEHMGSYPTPYIKLSSKLWGRHEDFRIGRIMRCYIVHKGKVALITKDDFDFDSKQKTMAHIQELLK